MIADLGRAQVGRAVAGIILNSIFVFAVDPATRSPGPVNDRRPGRGRNRSRKSGPSVARPGTASFGGGSPIHHRLQDLLGHTHARLGAEPGDGVRLQSMPDDRPPSVLLASDPDQRPGRSILLSTGMISRSLSMRQIHVGQGLGFHALARRPPPGAPLHRPARRAAHLVGEVHVAWGIDQVEDVLLPVIGRRVVHPGGLEP